MVRVAKRRAWRRLGLKLDRAPLGQSIECEPEARGPKIITIYVENTHHRARLRELRIVIAPRPA